MDYTGYAIIVIQHASNAPPLLKRQYLEEDD